MTRLLPQLTPDELGTIEAVLIEFNRHQMPRLLDIKTRLDRGEILDEFEIIFLQATLQEVQQCEYFVQQHPDFTVLLSEVASLYTYITRHAAENEKKLFQQP